MCGYVMRMRIDVFMILMGYVDMGGIGYLSAPSALLRAFRHTGKARAEYIWAWDWNLGIYRAEWCRLFDRLSPYLGPDCRVNWRVRWHVCVLRMLETLPRYQDMDHLVQVNEWKQSSPTSSE